MNEHILVIYVLNRYQHNSVRSYSIDRNTLSTHIYTKQGH